VNFFDDRIFGSRVHPQFLFDCSSRNNRDSQIIMAGASTSDEILDISDVTADDASKYETLLGFIGGALVGRFS
jgi:hypothetical protein